MIDLKLLRDDPKGTERLLRTKRPDVSVDKLLAVDAKLRTALTAVEKLREEKNRESKEIPALKETQRKKAIASLQKLDEKLKKHEAQLAELTAQRETLLKELPNLPRPDVKEGNDERANEILRTVGTIPSFAFPARDALGLTEALDLADIPRAAKTSGSRFVFFKGALAQLEFAIVRYAFVELEKKGFLPVVPPVLINRRSMEGMGYLGHGGEEEVYHLEKDDLFLVGTAEQAVGPMYQNEVIPEDELPLRFAAFSTAFRREAGSYGKDTKGFLRVHQFDKIEMFSFTTPQTSDDEHERFLAIEEELMQALKIPYQVIKMCTGDLGDPAARKYDIEAWIPSEKKYRETHSTSTCTDFQSRRLNIRYKSKQGNAYVHTVNGTGFAIGRTMIAILENFQNADGTIRVPDALQPYTGFSVIAKTRS